MKNSVQVEQFVNRLHEIHHEKSDLEREEAEIKAELLNQMQEEQVEKLENAKVRITYIDKSTRKRVDGQMLKKEFPEIYKKCVKESEIKAYLRVQVLS